MKCRWAAAAILVVAVVSASTVTRAQAPAAAETFDAVWSIVRDHHFDPAFDITRWNAVRDELRPKALAANTSGELRAVLADMLGRLGLSHFAVIPSSPDSPGDRADLTAEPGFDVRVLDKQLVVTSVDPESGAAAAGVRPGWMVQRIGSVEMSAIVGTVPDGPSMRLAQLDVWRKSLAYLRGRSDSAADITFLDGSNASVTKSIRRSPEHGDAVTVGNLPTMYVRVSSFPARTPAGKSAGVIGFNVWMTPVNGPFQQAIDTFRAHSGIQHLPVFSVDATTADISIRGRGQLVPLPRYDDL